MTRAAGDYLDSLFEESPVRTAGRRLPHEGNRSRLLPHWGGFEIGWACLTLQVSRTSPRRGEAADRFLGVAEDLAADEAFLADVPDPGDGHVADSQLAAAGVDTAADEEGAAVALDHLGGDQQLVPGPLDVEQVLL